MSVQPGWFPDPAGDPDTYRWWDGRGWTRWLGVDPQAGEPTDPVPGPVAAPVATAAEPVEADPVEPEHVGPEQAGPEQAGPEPAGPEQAEPDPVPSPRSGRIRAPLAIALVVGVLVVALVAVGLTVVLTQDRIRTGPPLAPPSAPDESALVYDDATRTVRVQSLEMELPGAPYVCATKPQSLGFAFSSALTCDVVIHRDYEGENDWYASAGFGIIERSEVTAQDDTATARTLFSTLQRQFFQRTSTTVKRFGLLAASAKPTEEGVYLGGEVHYAIKGLPSTYDRLVVAVFPLANGDYAAFFTSRPDDTPTSTLVVLNQALASLRVR